MTAATTNPWNLTQKETQTMAAIVKVGRVKVAAQLLGVTPRSVEISVRAIRVKMRVESIVVAAVLFDRFTRGEGS